MQLIILLACASKKDTSAQKARNLYTSQLFRGNLAYAEMLEPDKIFILSAKYGLVGLDDVLEPYDLSLNDMSEMERVAWAKGVIDQLEQETNLQKDAFMFLAGETYRKHLIPQITNYSIPMQGLGIGRQLQFLKAIEPNYSFDLILGK